MKTEGKKCRRSASGRDDKKIKRKEEEEDEGKMLVKLLMRLNLVYIRSLL
jgi:hypothetical protein